MFVSVKQQRCKTMLGYVIQIVSLAIGILALTSLALGLILVISMFKDEE